MNKLTIENLDVWGKTVMVRVDFNVPLNENQQVTDDTRIVASLPTIRFLLENGARLILVSHLGRPKGNPKPELSLEPVAVRLSELLGKPVVFKPFSKEINTISPIDELKNGDCLLMENIRFYPEEEQNDEQFSKSLASLADKFVNDAFGTARPILSTGQGVVAYRDCFTNMPDLVRRATVKRSY